MKINQEYTKIIGAKISAYLVFMYNGSLDIMSKAGHFPLQILFILFTNIVYCLFKKKKTKKKQAGSTGCLMTFK